MATGSQSLCARCHVLDGRLPGRPVEAGCVHEHMTTLVLCAKHEKFYRRMAPQDRVYCIKCMDATGDLVHVRIVTPALA